MSDPATTTPPTTTTSRRPNRSNRTHNPVGVAEAATSPALGNPRASQIPARQSGNATAGSSGGTSSLAPRSHRQIEPEAVPLLEAFLEYEADPTSDNGREAELNDMYSNQIFHAASRYKGPKVGDGFEELVASQHPLQVIYPDRYNTTGLAYSATGEIMKETHHPTQRKRNKFCFCIPLPDRDYDPMVMYSSDNPQLYDQFRYKFAHVLLWVFMAVCLLMAILCLIIAPHDYDDYSFFRHRSSDSYDIINIITCVISLGILVLGVATKNPKIVLVFVIVYTIDAFVNLLRLYSILQFLYFLAQLILVFLANFYRMLISPQWYYSL